MKGKQNRRNSKVTNKESSFHSRRIAPCFSKENIFDRGSEQVELLELKSFTFCQLPLSKIRVNAQSSHHINHINAFVLIFSGAICQEI